MAELGLEFETSWSKWDVSIFVGAGDMHETHFPPIREYDLTHRNMRSLDQMVNFSV